MKRLSFIIVITSCLCLMMNLSWASKAYITDSFKISLRAGPSLEQEEIGFLSSGQAVEVLEAQGEWSLVQVSEQDQEALSGWVLSRYLITQLPWEIQAKTIKEGNTQLEKALSLKERELRETAHREQILISKMDKLTFDLEESRNKYEALKQESVDFIKLKEAYKVTNETVDRLIKENADLKSLETYRYFIAGALILLCGLLLGVLFGRQQKKIKSYY